MNNYSGKVRIIERDEIDSVMQLCRELHDENGIFKMEDSKVRTMLDRAFDKQGGILAGIGAKGKLEGLMLIMLSNFWYTSECHWEEIFLYVLQEHRKTRNAVELIKFAKWCAEQTPYPLFIGIMPNAASQRKVHLYDRQLNSDMGAEIDLAYANGMVEALTMVNSGKDVHASIGNVKKVANEKRAKAEKAIKQATTQKGYFFIYTNKAA